MSGTTRTVQKPLDTRNFLVVLAMAAIVLAATVTIAWSAANLAKTAPTVGDLGSRDLDAAAAIGSGFGAPGAFRGTVGPTSGGSATLVKDDLVIKTNAQAGFQPGFLVDADQRRMQSNTSSEGAPAARHAGLRAQ